MDIEDKKYVDKGLLGCNLEVIEEDVNNKRVSGGVYSVLNNKWLKEPVQQDIPEVDQEKLESTLSEWEDKYFTAQESNDIDTIDEFIDSLYAFRQEGLNDGGEFSIPNLVFKELRNLGYLQQLKDLKTELTQKKLSLESLVEELKNTGDLFWHIRDISDELNKEYDYVNLYLEDGIIKPIPKDKLKGKFAVSCEQAREGKLATKEELLDFKKEVNGEFIVFFVASDSNWGGEYSVITSDEELAKKATDKYDQDGYACYDEEGNYLHTLTSKGKIIDESLDKLIEKRYNIVKD